MQNGASEHDNLTDSNYMNFVGQFYGCFGIPNHTREFARALINELSGVNLVQLIQKQQLVSTDLYNMGPDFTKHFGSPDPDFLNLIFYYPDVFPQWTFSDKGNLGYYIFEYTKIPERYVNIINEELDGICTASQWGADVLKGNGVTIPIFVVHGGVDTNKFYPPTKRPHHLTEFKFLHVGKAEQRKGTGIVIEAFVRAFKDNPKVTLTLSIDNIFIPDFSAERLVGTILDQLGASSMADRIKILHFVPDIKELYDTHHVAVFATKAEGIGLPIIEAMACGMPVITPMHSGITEYATSATGIFLTENKEEPVWDPHFFPKAGSVGTWQCPSTEELTRAMIWTLEHPKTAAHIGYNAAKWIEKNYTWKIAAKDFADRFVRRNREEWR